MAKCFVCDGPRTIGQAMCAGCQREFGSSSKHWPQWVKALRTLAVDYRRKPGGITGVPPHQRIRLVSFEEK